MDTSIIPHRSRTPDPNLLTPGVATPGERQVMLSEPQQQALEWLTNGGSVTEAAQLAGVARNTVSRWLHHDPDFREMFDAAVEQAAMVTEARLVGLQEVAV